MADPQKKPPQNSKPNQGDVFHVSLLAPSREALAKAIRELALDVDHQHPEKRDDAAGELHTGAFLNQEQIEQLRQQGWKLEVHENLSEAGRERQKEVAQGDRFEGGKVPPKGL